MQVCLLALMVLAAAVYNVHTASLLDAESILGQIPDGSDMMNQDGSLLDLFQQMNSGNGSDIMNMLGSGLQQLMASIQQKALEEQKAQDEQKAMEQEKKGGINIQLNLQIEA
jgi:hypothetical protein